MNAERTIDTMTKPTGRPPGRPKGGAGRQVVTVSVSLTPEERETLTEVCASLGITQSDFVRLALRHAAVLAALHKESK